MSLTQEQINEVCEFQAGLSQEDEWLFFNLAAVGKESVTWEDKYEVMQRWDELKEAKP